MTNITIITNKQMEDFIENKWVPKNDLLLTYDDNCKKWVACDDSTGQKWVEEFNNKEDAISWLNGEFEL